MERWQATFYASAASRIEGTKDEAKKALLEAQEVDMTRLLNSSRFHSLLATRRQLTLAPSSSFAHPSHPTADPSCDPAYPRIFHIFWAGPFTDKPYAAALSFLYSQRLALASPIGTPPDPLACRPQMWIWINPGPASSLPDPRAEERMKDELRANPWSSPLLHHRFADVVKFRLWNTSEQLDGVREMEGWREMRLFNSGGVKYGSDVVRLFLGLSPRLSEAYLLNISNRNPNQREDSRSSATKRPRRLARRPTPRSTNPTPQRTESSTRSCLKMRRSRT